ncbi:MAG: putative anti-sigma factor antagonist [Alphaproteobacteria bacterium MarineAlpha5_Bin5]|nr:MAG: putative anti-sigma factor antagonist [Alphaproteobacteria bacterium MarineAlpha5_Bin5]PPR52469.1 MAG: putative anti-sigma factor antagonist [Alphaproteobacteria bacterium MarineAlpha5_Bin4]|tara:strand:- start:449 stop:790 length:342 start_codon:yes stop_codon:yes gene_type:complete
MAITVENINNGSMVRISGEVDLSVSPEVKEKILAQIEINKKEHNFTIAKSVYADLSEVSYIDSSGIASLIHSHQQAVKAGVNFYLFKTSPGVLKVIKLARLDSIFKIVDTIQE